MNNQTKKIGVYSIDNPYTQNSLQEEQVKNYNNMLKEKIKISLENNVSKIKEMVKMKIMKEAEAKLKRNSESINELKFIYNNLVQNKFSSFNFERPTEFINELQNMSDQILQIKTSFKKHNLLFEKLFTHYNAPEEYEKNFQESLNSIQLSLNENLSIFNNVTIEKDTKLKEHLNDKLALVSDFIKSKIEIKDETEIKQTLEKIQFKLNKLKQVLLIENNNSNYIIEKGWNSEVTHQMKINDNIRKKFDINSIPSFMNFISK